MSGVDPLVIEGLLNGILRLRERFGELAKSDPKLSKDWNEVETKALSLARAIADPKKLIELIHDTERETRRRDKKDIYECIGAVLADKCHLNKQQGTAAAMMLADLDRPEIFQLDPVPNEVLHRARQVLVGIEVSYLQQSPAIVTRTVKLFLKGETGLTATKITTDLPFTHTPSPLREEFLRTGSKDPITYCLYPKES